MVNSKDYTVTDARMKEILKKSITPIIMDSVPQMISNAAENVSLRTGRAIKFYPYLDKFEVELHNINKVVLCKRLHLFGADLIDLYTPLADRREFDEKRKEPCIIPRFELNCVILNINDEDSNESLLLGFYQNNELVGLNPAQPGNLKLTSLFSENNQFWIKFGRDGLDLRLPSKVKSKIGYDTDDMTELEYADSKNVYTKDECYNKTEVYTKEEVDELIAQRIAEFLQNQEGE